MGFVPKKKKLEKNDTLIKLNYENEVQLKILKTTDCMRIEK